MGLESLKYAIHTRLARSGLAVMRTEPRARPEMIYSKESMARLVADIEAIGLNPQEWEIWTSPKAVLDYLKPTRVNSYQQVVELCAAHGIDLNGKTVLDVGTSSGYLLRLIEEQFEDVELHGTDYYEECVRLSRALVPSAQLSQASIDELKAGDSRFDVIFCTEVLEHILDTETQIPALLSMVNPGGALVLTVPNAQHDFTPAFTSPDGNSYVGHVNYWTEQSWGYYIGRITGGMDEVVDAATGTHSNLFVGDVLHAVIRKA